MNQITPAQLHRHGPKRACAARCRPLVCYQAGRTGPCRTAPSPQAPHTTPHPPRPPVGPFSASTRPDSAAAVRSAPPPCRHVPALPGWFAPPHGGERRRAAAHRPYGSPGCAPCRPARRLRQEGGHGHRNRCPGCLGACGARPRSAYIPVVWNATHVQMRASAASTPQRGSTRPPGWAGSLRGSSRLPLHVEAPCSFQGFPDRGPSRVPFRVPCSPAADFGTRGLEHAPGYRASVIGSSPPWDSPLCAPVALRAAAAASSVWSRLRRRLTHSLSQRFPSPPPARTAPLRGRAQPPWAPRLAAPTGQRRAPFVIRACLGGNAKKAGGNRTHFLRTKASGDQLHQWSSWQRNRVC